MVKNKSTVKPKSKRELYDIVTAYLPKGTTEQIKNIIGDGSVSNFVTLAIADRIEKYNQLLKDK